MRPEPFAAALLLLATGCAQAAPPAATPCAAAAPADIAPGRATWLGPCRGGRAEGVGTLRVAGKGGPRLFFGRMAAGRPISGVMPTPAGDWIPAWRFDTALRPRDDPSGSRQTSVDTFRIAAAGAAEAARRFRAAGNAGSAAFYDRQRAALEAALD